MNLIINGEEQTIESVSTVNDVLHHFELQDRIVVVEHNRSVLEKHDHKNTPLQEGDRLEIVHFVGGG